MPAVEASHAKTLPFVSDLSDPEDEGLQQRIAAAYGTHLLHVMHILLTGKWDPVNLLDDDDHWVSTQGFGTAAKHATSAAEAISAIFDDDFDLSFMPWLWGIYLLQGSFLLLLVADKLQKQTTPTILKACENIVRAHEACVVTLDNEYQVCSIVVPSRSHRLIHHALEKLSKDHDLGHCTGQRATNGRSGRPTATSARSAITIPMDWVRRWIGAVNYTLYWTFARIRYMIRYIIAETPSSVRQIQNI